MNLKLAALGVALLGYSWSARGDWSVKIDNLAFDYSSGVGVTNVIVNGESRGKTFNLTVPDGARLELVFKENSGYILGSRVAVFPSVDADLTINSLPDSIRAHTGTAADPVLIESYDDLVELRDKVAAGCITLYRYFRQTVDIDCSAGGPWVGIGTAQRPFGGTYDGGGHRLSGVTFPSESRAAFFQYVKNGTIKNLTVEMLGFVESEGKVIGGGFIGSMQENSEVVHVITEGELLGVNYYTAGLVVLASRGTISGCTNRVTISGSAGVIGGLVANNGDSTYMKLAGVTYTDCANEGALTAVRVDGKIGGSGGIGGLTGKVEGNHVATYIRCRNVGQVTPWNKYDSFGGSIIGIHGSDKGTVVSGIDCEATADQSPVGRFLSTPHAISGFDFAEVREGLARFCPPPSTAGVFRVMLANSAALVLADVAVGDRLELENRDLFSGTVACADPTLAVREEEGGWTVIARTGVSAGTLTTDAESGLAVFTPADGQTDLTVTGFQGERLQIPSSLERIAGVDKDRIRVVSGGHDITPAVAFVGTAETGYQLELDGRAEVNGVKVTPTIGEDVPNAFSVENEARIVIRAIPGLWYGLVRGTEVGAVNSRCESVRAEGDSVSLEDATPPASAAYYKIEVSLRPFTD